MEMIAMRAEPHLSAKEAAYSKVTDAQLAWNVLTAGLSKMEFDELLSYDGTVESGGMTPEDDSEQSVVTPIAKSL